MGYIDNTEEDWRLFVVSDNYRWTLLVTLCMAVHYFFLAG